MIWTDEMDASIRRGHEAGLSARLISEQLGVTRNAVLGRTFRLGLCKSYSEPREPTSTAARRVSMTAVLMQKNFLPAQLAEHIRDLRDMGASWKAVGDDLGVSMITGAQLCKQIWSSYPIGNETDILACRIFHNHSRLEQQRSRRRYRGQA